MENKKSNLNFSDFEKQIKQTRAPKEEQLGECVGHIETDLNDSEAVICMVILDLLKAACQIGKISIRRLPAILSTIHKVVTAIAEHCSE